MQTENIAAALAPVKAIWEQTFPGFVYEYKFLDDKIGSFYKQELQLSQFYKIFSALAIFLGCLGLYGLASFMTAQRIKEVWYPQSFGRLGRQYYLLVFERIYFIGYSCICYCGAACLVLYASLVTGLRLPGRD
ncbi:hypothetical protein LWM68_26805 [Niabella sp. W65]|nr:hypothetical protein [Niabella sp. W65]MCH7366061.1 hypothetical protein [Niabella sp. W65]